MIRTYLSNIIDDHRDEWEIQLTIEISFICNIDPNETSIMHIKSKTPSVLIGYETVLIVEEIFDSLLEKYQEKLKESMKNSNYVFDRVDVLFYKFHEINLNRGDSYIVPPEWLKIKRQQSLQKIKKMINTFSML